MSYNGLLGIMMRHYKAFCGGVRPLRQCPHLSPYTIQGLHYEALCEDSEALVEDWGSGIVSWQ